MDTPARINASCNTKPHCLPSMPRRWFPTASRLAERLALGIFLAPNIELPTFRAGDPHRSCLVESRLACSRLRRSKRQGWRVRRALPEDQTLWAATTRYLWGGDGLRNVSEPLRACMSASWALVPAFIAYAHVPLHLPTSRISASGSILVRRCAIRARTRKRARHHLAHAHRIYACEMHTRPHINARADAQAQHPTSRRSLVSSLRRHI